MVAERIHCCAKWIILSLSLLGEAYAEQEITGGDVRAILDGTHALDSEGYALYRICIASVPLGTEFKTYIAGLQKCKQEAKERAYRVTLDETVKPVTVPAKEAIKQQTMPSEGSDPVAQDRAWQQEKLKKY
jgi:hypothetical protein